MQRLNGLAAWVADNKEARLMRSTSSKPCDRMRAINQIQAAYNDRTATCEISAR